jgi:hypothetical protein
MHSCKRDTRILRCTPFLGQKFIEFKVVFQGWTRFFQRLTFRGMCGYGEALWRSRKLPAGHNRRSSFIVSQISGCRCFIAQPCCMRTWL